MDIDFSTVFLTKYSEQQRQLKKKLLFTLTISAKCALPVKIIIGSSVLTRVSRYASCSLSSVTSCNRRMILADERHNLVDTEKTVEITRLSKASSLKKLEASNDANGSLELGSSTPQRLLDKWWQVAQTCSRKSRQFKNRQFQKLEFVFVSLLVIVLPLISARNRD